MTDHQEFFFSADSPTQLNQWMDALKYAIEFYKRVIIPFSEVKKIEIIKHNSSLLLNDSISIQTQQEQHIFSFLTHLKVAYDLMNRLWKNTTHTGRKSSGSLSKQEEESNEMFKDEVIQKKEEEDFRKLFKLSQDELIECKLYSMHFVISIINSILFNFLQRLCLQFIKIISYSWSTLHYK